jgi:hypothetical protein
MKTESFREQLLDYVLSGHAYLHAPTTEKTRFLTELKSLAESLPDGGRRIFVWSQATGWRDSDDQPPKSTSGNELARGLISLPPWSTTSPLSNSYCPTMELLSKAHSSGLASSRASYGQSCPASRSATKAAKSLRSAPFAWSTSAQEQLPPASRQVTNN